MDFLLVASRRVALMIAFGERLTSLRRSAGLSVDELAERAGVTDSAVEVAERGLLDPPLSRIEVLAKGLNVPPESLIHDLAVEARCVAGTPTDSPASTAEIHRT